MNKFFLALFSLWCTFQVLQAQQVQIGAIGRGEITVNGYEGATRNDIMTAQMHIARATNADMSQWSLTYRVNGNISNGTKTFPPEKIKLRFSDLTYQDTNDANVIPTPSSLMLNTGLLPLSTTPSFMAQNSIYNLALLAKWYMQLNLNYDAIVDSGVYLAQYSSGTAYTINITLEVKDKNQVVKASATGSFSLKIVPIYSNYGMLFDPAAQNISLVFNTANAYTAGVSTFNPQAFSTVSTTGYTVKVSTLNTNLTGSGNNTLPVDAIKLTVKDNITQATLGPVNLSTTKSTVIDSNSGHTTKFFDTTYSTAPGDSRFLNKPFGQYSGTVVFEMAPK